MAQRLRISPPGTAFDSQYPPGSSPLLVPPPPGDPVPLTSKGTPNNVHTDTRVYTIKHKMNLRNEKRIWEASPGRVKGGM